MDVPLCALDLAPISTRLSSAPPAAHAIATDVAREFYGGARRLEEAVSHPARVSGALDDLATVARAAAARIEDEWGAASPGDEDSSNLILETALTPGMIGLTGEGALEALMPVLKRYDNYFGTRRILNLSAVHQMWQLLTTADHALSDLRNCVIDLNEIRVIVDALSSALIIEETVREESDVQRNWQSDPIVLAEPSDEPIADQALWRWKVGHHLFNSLVVAACQRLYACTEANSPEEIVPKLRAATTIFRGTTSAMWYAECFPTALYKQFVRPTMVTASGKGSGFSGTDNLEFHFFKIASTSLLEFLHETFGSPLTWPNELWLTAWDFLEKRQLDLEHHTLIAEKVVGLDPSLKQRRLAEQLREDDEEEGVEDVPPPAVDQLRDLVEKVRKEKKRLRMSVVKTEG